MDKGEYKLPIPNTLHKSMVTVADNSLALFWALLLPSIIMTLVSVGQILMLQHAMALRDNGEIFWTAMNYMMITNLSTIIITGILAAIFAVTCHRIVLLGKESLPNSFGLYFSKRELKYFGWIFLFSLPMGIGYIVTPMIVPLFMKSMDDPRALNLLFQAWGIAGLFIVSFITAPFILVLPATAIGEKSAFSKARSTVKGNIIRVAIVLLIPALITLLIRLVLRRFGPEPSNIPYDVFTGLIYLLFLVFQTVVLSISYKTLAFERLENTY